MEISKKISTFSDQKKKDCDLTYISDKSEHANTFDVKKVNIKNLQIGALFSSVS